MRYRLPHGATRPRLPGLRHSLSRRVLGLTLLVVLVTEALLFVPALVRERRNWLDERLIAAQIAIRALPPSDRPGFPGPISGAGMREDLLRLAGVAAIRLQEPGRPMAELSVRGNIQAASLLDLRHETMLERVGRALAALTRGSDRLVLVIAPSPKQPSALLSVVLREGELTRSLRASAGTIALSGLLIAGVAGLIVFALLQWLLVRPMQRLIDSIAAFRADPERTPPLDAALVTPLARDEIAVAAAELGAMQRELRAALWRNARLAALGTAVAKVSHDLRGALSPALLAAERLQAHADPVVARTGDLLAKTVERATALVRATLEFARDAPPPPARARVHLRSLADEAAQQALAVDRAVAVENRVPDDLVAFADPAALVRVLGNLMRNAAEAGARRITLSGAIADARSIELRVGDDGPGLPDAVRAALFRPFVSGGRQGGSGLGLAICRDLLRAQGGEVAMAASGPAGTEFRLTLPVGPSRGEAGRGEAARPPPGREDSAGGSAAAPIADSPGTAV